VTALMNFASRPPSSVAPVSVAAYDLYWNTMDQGSDQHNVHLQWQEHHQYPHSHHGTPAQEYPQFIWSQSQLPVENGNHMEVLPQRPSPQMLEPLVMPQWPSMLSSQTPSKAVPMVMSQPPLQTMAAPSTLTNRTPVSASSTSSNPNARKTLSDDDRRQMCVYHEKHPAAKQVDIGGMSLLNVLIYIMLIGF
jgi:hypothetical protein